MRHHRHRSESPVRLLAALLCACTSGGGGPTITPDTTSLPGTTTPTWELAWADEFNGTAVDPAIWIIVDGAAEVNSELQYYTPEDVYLENGSLVLRSQRRAFHGRSYTSGEVRTGTKRTVTPPVAIEWRTRSPRGKGIWPANWLVNHPCTGLQGCGSNWPPEIDVLEIRGSRPDVNIATHWWGAWPNQRSQTTEINGPDFSADYHTFRVEWRNDSITWFLDGVRRAVHTQNVTSGQLQLVMNTAVGGHFDGPPDGTTEFPQYHRIDYVRVYRFR
jgi:beta-glucanase (GH16 family)